MKKTYYNLSLNSYYRGACLLYPTPELNDICWLNGVDCNMSQFYNIVVKLPSDVPNAQYFPIMPCHLLPFCYAVSQDMLNVMKPFVQDYDGVEFVPITAESDKYGSRQYYLMHFKCYEDVIDYEHSKILDGMVLVPTLKAEPIRNLHLFTIQSVAETIVSRELRLAIIKAGQKASLMFDKVRLDTDIVE